MFLIYCIFKAESIGNLPSIEDDFLQSGSILGVFLDLGLLIITKKGDDEGKICDELLFFARQQRVTESESVLL